MTRRRLTAEEIELWHKVVEKTERLTPGNRPAPTLLPKPKPVKTPAVRLPPAPPPRKPIPSSSDLNMDRKTFGKMKRGRLEPEGRLDLHGMTLDQAHPALTRFILSAQASGKRLVLVITGKGKSGEDSGPIPRPRGAIRREVPLWLGSPPLAQAVLQIAPAHLRHGGEGAFYIYLRRDRPDVRAPFQT